MVIELEKTATHSILVNSLETIRYHRDKEKKTNLIEFFGAMPNIGDGLEFQRTVRNVLGSLI